jgi:Galactosyltransferase.
MDKTKVIYNFQVCEAYHNTRTRALYNTICSQIAKRNEECYLISGFNEIDEIPLLQLTENDDYHSAIDKTLQCFLYHEEKMTEFDFLFYGDDDTFINFRNMDSFVKTLSRDELAIYGNLQRMFRFNEPKEDIHHTGGAGILMNKKTFNVVAEAIRKYYIRDRVFSDVSLALNIKKCNQNARKKIKLLSGMNFIQDHRWPHEAPPLIPEHFHKITTYHLRSWLKDKSTYEEVLEVYNRLSIYDN